MRDRFTLDEKENILFIDLAGVRLESRAQVDEVARLVRETVERHGRRVYSVVNYEGTEIAPEVVEYYGEQIRELQARHALSTVRYSSSGLTRSMLRYLGAAVDLESNIFTTREEAIRRIRELESRRMVPPRASAWTILNPHRSLLGKFALGWFVAGLAVLFAIYLWGYLWDASPERHRLWQLMAASSVLSLIVGAVATGVILFVKVFKPLDEMQEFARRLVIGGAFEPVRAKGEDEVGQLARGLNEAAGQLRRDIERLSGLYHISLIMGTGTEVSRICELLTGKIARLLDAEMCVILLYDEREGRINAQLPAYGVTDERVLLLRSTLEEKNIAAWVFRTGEPYLTNDVASDPLISQAAALMLGVRSVLAVPLQAGERRLGTLEVMNKDGGFAEEDKRLVTIFAAQAAHLLGGAQLFEQIRESEERHRQIFESALDGLYRATPDARLITVNPALTAMLGYDEREELVGANLVRDLFADERAGKRLMEELAARNQVHDVECELRRKSGEGLPTRISVRAVAAGGEVHHLGIVRDVTEQKRLTEQLMISEQLATVGELVAGVAHEVRNPLCGITTTLSALARRVEDRESVRPFLDVVMSEANHLNRLMEQLLEHSRPARPGDDSADIRDIIREALGEWRGYAVAKNIRLDFTCPDAVPGVCLDRRKMHGVFTNLLDNSLRHTAPGGCVRVRLALLNGDARSVLRIEVSDTGAGVIPAHLPRIFEPFFTTRADGTGLGLAIVRKAVHDHGGTITARSEPGQGTTFTITLPHDLN